MNNMKVFYVRNDYRKRDITIVSDLQEVNGKNVVKFSWAFRSNHDKFVKKEGKNLAKQRLQDNDPHYTSSFEIEEPKFRSICAKILENILQNKNTPKKYIEDIEWDIHYFENDSHWKSPFPRHQKY